MNTPIKENPRESCGLLVVIKGKEKYIPCKNLAARSKRSIYSRSYDWANAEDQGEITAVVHSHPVTSPQPSEADKISCEKSGVKWWIVQPNLKQWGSCEPCG